MALIEAVSMTLSAAFEVASLIWMELAMFGVAALVYLFAVGGAPVPFMGAGPSKKKVMDEDAASAPKARKPRADAHGVPNADHRAALKSWQEMKIAGSTPDVELSSVVHSMQKLGKSAPEIITELRSALDANPGLLPNVLGLPATLLRDDAVQLLDGTLKLLQDHGQSVDIALHAGLMSAQLRRRDYEGVAASAQRVPAEALTPKMRCMLATSAAFRKRLDEAFGQLRQMPVPTDGGRCIMPSTAAVQLLTLAVQEQRLAAALAELQRIQARLEAKHLDDLVVAESKRPGGATTCRELINAGITLNTRAGPHSYQALVSALASSGQTLELRELIDELEAEGSHGPSGLAVSEPFATALLAAAKTLLEYDLVPLIVELHRVASAGAPGAGQHVVVRTVAD
jgi:hypothetical protein